MASEGLGFRQSGQDTVKHRDPAHTTEELKITATQGNSTFPQVKGLEPSKDNVDLRERGAAGAVDAMIHPLVRPLAEHTSIVRACALLGPFKSLLRFWAWRSRYDWSGRGSMRHGSFVSPGGS
jgi:hypothetical protein